MNEMPSVRGNSRRPVLRVAGRKGSEMIEFTLVLFPLFAFIFVTLDIAWALFAEGTLQYAVRRGVRYGVTNQPVPNGSSLTAEVKSVVQFQSLGILYGPSGISQIKVYYYKADPGTGALTDVSSQSDGNAGGNIMVVSVPSFVLVPLLPRVFYSGVDNNPLTFSVESADRIEPTRSPPPIGSAP
jgi:Flp pilus assembly protein TadG